MKRLFLCLAILLMVVSCGVEDETPQDSSQSRDVGVLRPNCSRLADEYDRCILSMCKEIDYPCILCNCIKAHGDECKFSAHKDLDNCSESEDEEAEYMLDNVICSEYLEGFEELCPPPKTDNCKIERDNCFTDNNEKGICVKYDNNKIKCEKLCTDIGYSYQCSADESCYPVDKFSLCLGSGGQGEGRGCQYVNDCIGGNVCLQVEGGSFSCYKVCKSNMECDSSKSCVDTGMGYSVCTN
ncbi:MAG: hypothetical protein ACP5QK_09430 [Myxococcota bacterium]